jgi:hypothetical protein
MNGASATDIQRLAGHRDLATTKRYMHLSPSHLANAIKALEKGRETKVEQTRVDMDGGPTAQNPLVHQWSAGQNNVVSI